MNNNRESYTIGQQLAAAREKERQRLAQSNLGNSPLPSFKYFPCDHSLVNPVLIQLDHELRHLTQQFSELDSSERNQFRKRISLEEFYTLLTFAQRSAVFAMRTKDVEILRAGFRAIAMIEKDRTDYRDILITISLLYYAAGRIGFNPDLEISKAAELSEPNVHDLILTFASRSDNYKSIKQSWGFLEVNSRFGLGFVGWGFHDYNTKIDLLSVSLEISEMIKKDQYLTDDPELGSSIPEVWFGKQNASAKQELKEVTGVVKINAHLDEQFSKDAWGQQFTVWIAEILSTKSVAHLFEMAHSIQPDSYCLLALAVGRLFCLAIARSYVIDVESFEKGNSLRRFEKGFEKVLREAQ